MSEQWKPEIDGTVRVKATGQIGDVFEINEAPNVPPQFVYGVTFSEDEYAYFKTEELEPPPPSVRERFMKEWQDDCLAFTLQGLEGVTYMEWLEERVVQQRVDIADEMTRFFEGRIPAPPQNEENVAAWISRAIGFENNAYQALKSELNENPRIIDMLNKVLSYATTQIKSVAEMSLTHSERRGALKALAYDLESRQASANSDYPPGRAQATDDIPF